MASKNITLFWQDQRTTTPAMAMKIVADNIEYGNKQVLERLCKSDGNA
jgi:hypothetical protein